MAISLVNPPKDVPPVLLHVYAGTTAAPECPAGERRRLVLSTRCVAKSGKRNGVTEDKEEKLPAFARDVVMGKHSFVQSVHWRMLYHPDDVAGDKLTIDAIPPYHSVQSVMQMLADAISQVKDKT